MQFTRRVLYLLDQDFRVTTLMLLSIGQLRQLSEDYGYDPEYPNYHYPFTTFNEEE